jgi:hypothetical protein
MLITINIKILKTTIKNNDCYSIQSQLQKNHNLKIMNCGMMHTMFMKV